jgi:flagellar protein FliO/FliZ
MIQTTLIPAVLFYLASSAHAAESTATVAAAPPGSLLQVSMGLMVVLGLMAAAAWMLKRLGVAKSSTATAIRIVGGVSVGNRERVMVVEVADQWIVVGVASGQVNALITMKRPESLPADPVNATTATKAGIDTGPKNFSTWLKQTIEKRYGGA